MYLTTDGVLYLTGRISFSRGTYNNGASNN